MTAFQTKHVHLVRHAKLEVDPLAAGLFVGRSDITACPTSTCQLVDQLAELPFEAVVSSPLQRCRVLAQPLADLKGLKAEYQPNLQERDWGGWDGLKTADIEPSELQAYYDDPFHYDIPQAESWHQMRERLNQAWCSLLNHPAQHILCITHGGVLRLMMQQILRLPDESLFQLKLDYGAQIRLQVTFTPTQPFVQLLELKAGNL